MGLLDAYQDSTDRALTVMAARPIDPEPPKPKHSGWSAIPRAVAGAFVETAGNILDVASAYGQVAAATGVNANPLIPDTPEDRKQRLEAFDKLKTDGIDWQPEESRPHYQMARDLRPDPLTAGLAENIVFGLTKGLTKAIGAGMIAGPVAGAGAFGVSEGMTTAEDLAAQGVDPVTRQKVGAVVGAVSAAGMALPVAGSTLAKTAALVAAGGPASFVAQQAATRAILENADYGRLAQQYDPLDPVGLALATLLPAGFATWAKAGAISAAMKGKPKAKTAAAQPAVKESLTVEPVRPAATPDEVDAAMVHNLTLARDAHDATPIETVQALHEADLASKAMPEDVSGKIEDIRGHSFDSMFEGYEKAADDLASMLDAMGFETRRESSRVSMSEYIYAKTPDYAENDVGDPISGRELKFRLSNHTLPSSYEQANFDVAVFHADALRPDVGGDITDALRYAAEKAGVHPVGEAKRLIDERSAQEVVAAEAEAARLVAAKDAHQQTLDLAHAFISRQPDGAIIGVSKRQRMTATLDGKIIDTLDTFPRDWASGTQAAKGQAPKMVRAEALAFLEGKGAAPANSRELGTRAPEGAGMQERPAVRADKSGQLEEPAQSGSGAGSNATLSEKVGAGDTALIDRSPAADPWNEPRTLEQRIDDKSIRTELLRMKNETGWAEVGGKLLRSDGEEGDVIGRTAWVPNAEWWPGRPKGLKEFEVKAAIDKAIAGEKLKAAERRVVEYMADVAEQRQKSAAWKPTGNELAETGLASHNELDVAMTARAAEIDPDAVESLAIRFESDDAGFMRGIKELLDERDRQTAASRQEGQRAQGAATRQPSTEAGTGQPVTATDGGPDPHIASTLSRADALKAQAPDLPVALREDGSHATLAEELDAIRQQAKEGTADTFGADDAPLIQVAVECMLSMGAA